MSSLLPQPRNFQLSKFNPPTPQADHSSFFFFFLRIRPPPRSPLFPSTTLFRSRSRLGLDLPLGAAQDDDEVPRCLRQELRSPVGLRPADHLAQRLLSGRRLPLRQREQ